MENRALRIDIDNAGFLYQWQECRGKLWWKKCEIKRELYDFTDPAVRVKLKHMGFKLKVVQ